MKTKTIKIQLTDNGHGEWLAMGLVGLGDAAKLINAKSTTAITRLVDSGKVRFIWISSARAFFVKDLIKIKEDKEKKV